LAACADLGLSDRTDGATEIVAKKVMELANDTRDPQQLRVAVLASFVLVDKIETTFPRAVVTACGRDLRLLLLP
jgi:hypothetical protein